MRPNLNHKNLSEATWCASDCQADCPMQLTYRVCKAAERQTITVLTADLSGDCDKYIGEKKMSVQIKPNTKIRILSPEHSEYVQKLAFESGFSWARVHCSHYEFWYFNENDSCKTISSGPSELVFLNASSSYQEITIGLPNSAEIPNSWSGEGLPPVGTICEVDPLDERESEECRVESYSIDKSVVTVSYQRDNGRYYSCWHIDDLLEFRPIETPEQKAKRKRQMWIDDIILNADVPESDDAYNTVCYVYDYLCKNDRLKQDDV